MIIHLQSVSTFLSKQFWLTVPNPNSDLVRSQVSGIDRTPNTLL